MFFWEVFFWRAYHRVKKMYSWVHHSLPRDVRCSYDWFVSGGFEGLGIGTRG